MKSEQLKKMILEELNEALSSKYNTLDKVLNALLKGEITKQQAKRFINDLNTAKPSAGMPAVDDEFGCGNISAKKRKPKNDDDFPFSCSSYNDRVRSGYGVRGC